MLIVFNNLVQGVDFVAKIPWTNSLYKKKALNVWGKIAYGLSDIYPLKLYLLQVISKFD